MRSITSQKFQLRRIVPIVSFISSAFITGPSYLSPSKPGNGSSPIARETSRRWKATALWENIPRSRRGENLPTTRITCSIPILVSRKEVILEWIRRVEEFSPGYRDSKWSCRRVERPPVSVKWGQNHFFWLSRRMAIGTANPKITESQTGNLLRLKRKARINPRSVVTIRAIDIATTSQVNHFVE
jgi:hypothetical protein